MNPRQEGTSMAVGHTEVPHEGCLAVREVLRLVGDKWSVLLVATLGAGPLRFSQLRRTIEGISQRMLTLTLRHLERDGLITRSIEPTIPPRVDYELTPLGRTLLEPVQALAGWAQEHMAQMEDARRRYDARVKPASTRSDSREYKSAAEGRPIS